MMGPGLMGVAASDTKPIPDLVVLPPLDLAATVHFAAVDVATGDASNRNKVIYSEFLDIGRTDGWFDHIRYVLPLIGDFKAMRVGHPFGIGSESLVFNGFTSDDWNERMGLIGDGATKFIDFGFSAPIPTGGLSVYLSVPPKGNTDQTYLGSHEGDNAYTLGRKNDNADNTLAYGGTVGGPIETAAPLTGFYHGIRSSSTLAQLFRNGEQIGPDYTDLTDVIESTLNLYAFCANIDGTPGSFLDPACRVCYLGMDDGLMTPDQVVSYAKAVVSMQTKLKRN